MAEPRGAAVPIPAPEWAPNDSGLMVPGALADRFHYLEARMGQELGDDKPDARFIAAAVLCDEAEERSEEAISRQARLFAAADTTIRWNPGTPVLLMGGYYLEMALTAPDTGLGFTTSPYGTHRPMGLLRSTAALEMDVMNDEGDPKACVASRQQGAHTRTFLTPDILLTAENIDETPAVVRAFPEEQVLVTGQEAIGRFFRTALAMREGSKAVKQRKLLVGEIVQELAAEEETFRSLPSPE